MTGQSLRHLSVGLFGAVMGIAGLGLAARAAASVFPGIVRAPAYFTEPWVALGALSLAILLPGYVVKCFRHPDAVREELSHPAQMGFCATLPLGMTLVAGGLAPYLQPLADAIWWAGVALLFLLQVWGIRRLLEGGIELTQVNAGWMILFIGGIVVPGSGTALGNWEAARFMFGVSCAATPLVMALVLYRAVVGPALPEAQRPSWFILLVPPSLVYAHGLVFYAELGFLESLYFFALTLVGGLLVYARGFLRWPFGAGWWAFTFPLDALAYAAVRYANSHPSMLWNVIAAAALALATLFVAIALVKTVGAFLRGTLLAPPSASPTPRSASSRAE